MKVGVPSEVKSDEYRVALTPVGATGARRARPRGADPEGRGRGQRDRGLPPTRPRVPGSCPVAEDVWGERRPGPQGQGTAARRGPSAAAEVTLFTYLHLAPAPESDPRASRLGCDLRRLRDGRGPGRAACRCSPRCRRSPGKIATQAGAFMLEKPLGGRGILLGGVPGGGARERDDHRRAGRWG